MNPKVSVVVPVYNVEKYLEACVRSILNQSAQNFEIILVDDGSTDNSGKICDAFKEKYDNIFVIHKENAGLSHTRNVGTEKARGDYVTYIDSDDVVHPDYLKILVSLVETYSADVASGGFLFCEEGDRPYFKEDSFETGTLTGKDFLKLVLGGRLRGTSACGLLIKKNLAREYLFPIGKFHEDDLTTYKYFMNATTVAYTQKPLYVYFQRKNSIMHKPFSKIDLDELDAGDEIYAECKKLGAKFEEAALAKKAENYFQVLFKFSDLKRICPQASERVNAFIDSKWITLLINRYIDKKSKVKIVLYKAKLLNVAKRILHKG